MTVIPVLVGFAPGVTLTVNVVASPGCTVLGVADPLPDGEVDTRTVREIEALPVRLCASSLRAHCVFQIRPLRVETDQYQIGYWPK